MSIDCTEAVLLNPAIETVVLVTGDGDMRHLVNLSRSHGKRVVLIAGSEGLRHEMRYLADQFVLYDNLIAGIVQTAGDLGKDEGKLKEALNVLGQAVSDIRAAKTENTFPAVKTHIQRLMPEFEEESFGFPRFEHFLFRGEAEGIIRVDYRSPGRVYGADENCDDSGKPVFGCNEWRQLIMLLREGSGTTPERRIILPPPSLEAEIRRRKILKDRPEMKAEEFISAARESGVLVPFREQRFSTRDKKWFPFFGLRLNEANSRVQIYLMMAKQKSSLSQATQEGAG